MTRKEMDFKQHLTPRLTGAGSVYLTDTRFILLIITLCVLQHELYEMLTGGKVQTW